MKKIKLLNKIDTIGTDELAKRGYEFGDGVESPDAILVRSAAMLDMQFNPELLAIARAGAGVNNIPLDRCAEEGIVVFNTPGANANGVKELTITALLLASRKVVQGIEWAKTLAGSENAAKQIEKGKSSFVGPEIKGKTLGVIGLGAIGGMVANSAYNLGMNVIGCDPYITVNAAWSLSRAVHKAESYDEIYEKCDYITIHVPSLPSTRGMINAETIAKMKDGVRIVNLARGDLVNNADMLAALASGKVAAYVTDFPDETIIGAEGVVAIPHLGASTPESEENCAVMAAQELIDYLENGIISNSVNYPAINQPRNTAFRTVVLHENIPSMLTQISNAFSAAGVNIEALLSQSKGNNAVSLLDTELDPSDNVADVIRGIKGIRRVVIIK